MTGSAHDLEVFHWARGTSQGETINDLGWEAAARAIKLDGCGGFDLFADWIHVSYSCWLRLWDFAFYGCACVSVVCRSEVLVDPEGVCGVVLRARAAQQPAELVLTFVERGTKSSPSRWRPAAVLDRTGDRVSRIRRCGAWLRDRYIRCLQLHKRVWEPPSYDCERVMGSLRLASGSRVWRSVLIFCSCGLTKSR